MGIEQILVAVQVPIIDSQLLAVIGLHLPLPVLLEVLSIKFGHV